MVQTNLNGRKHPLMHARTHIHLSAVVTNSTHSPQAGLPKTNLPIGPSSSSSSGWSSICRNIGNKKASVFPLPVLAIPIKSRPDIIAGIAWAWIGVGVSNPFLKYRCI